MVYMKGNLGILSQSQQIIGDGSKMKLEKKTFANVEKDYWFLRGYGVPVLTAIYMVGLAYREDIVVIGRPKT